MRRNGILLLVAAAIVVLPLIVTGNAEFGGSDGQAQGVIDEAGYQPWFEPLWDAAEQGDRKPAVLPSGRLGRRFARVLCRAAPWAR